MTEPETTQRDDDGQHAEAEPGRTSVPSIAMLGSPTVPPSLPESADAPDPATLGDVTTPADPLRLRMRNVHWEDELHAYVTAVRSAGEALGLTREEFTLAAVVREALYRFRAYRPEPADAAALILWGWRRDKPTEPPKTRSRTLWWEDDLQDWLRQVVRAGEDAGSKAFNISVVVREALYRFRTRYPEPAAAATAIIRGWEREAKREG